MLFLSIYTDDSLRYDPIDFSWLWPLTSQDMIAEGHSAAQIITQLHDLLVPMSDINDRQKSAIMERLAVSSNMKLQWKWNVQVQISGATESL